MILSKVKTVVPWSETKINLLVKAIDEVGSDSNVLQKRYFPERTSYSISNMIAKLRKKSSSGAIPEIKKIAYACDIWTKEETDRLIEGVKLWRNDYQRIQNEFVPTKTEYQIGNRARYIGKTWKLSQEDFPFKLTR